MENSPYMKSSGPARSWLPKTAVGGGGIAVDSEPMNEEENRKKLGGAPFRNFSAGRRPRSC